MCGVAELRDGRTTAEELEKVGARGDEERHPGHAEAFKDQGEDGVGDRRIVESRIDELHEERQQKQDRFGVEQTDHQCALEGMLQLGRRLDPGRQPATGSAGRTWRPILTGQD